MNTKVLIRKLLNNGEALQVKKLIESYNDNYDLEAYSFRGVYYFIIGEFEKAKDQFLKGLEFQEYNFDFNYNLGIIYYELKNYEKSFEYYLTAQFLCSDDNLKQEIKNKLNIILIQELILVEKGKEITEKVKKKFYYLDRNFPTIQEENMTCKLIKLFDKEYYIGVYDRYRAERDGMFDEISFKKYPMLYKVELIEVTSDNSFIASKKCILPIVCLKNNANIEFKYKDRVTRVEQSLKGRYYYYMVECGSEVNSRDDIFVGKPIQQENKGLKKLVLNIFVDGLSKSIIEDVGLENIMPNTYRFFSKGTKFNNCYVSGEWTYVNMASFYTGKYTTSHRVFHPKFNSTLPTENKILSEYFKESGYYTAKIDGDWRSVPQTGYIRGTDRYLYQSAIRGMNVEEVVCESIEHIEAFDEVNKFMWVCISDLHDIADEYEASVSVQASTNVEHRSVKNEFKLTSVEKSFDLNKRELYIKQIKKVDTYLGLLFQYIENNYDNDDIIISLFSDHGQGYLVPDNKEFLSDMRVKVPMMFRGAGFEAKESNEIIQGLDLMPILLNRCGIELEKGLDCNLPKCLGGEREREYAYTESIFPEKTYKASLRFENKTFYFETEDICRNDGSVNIEKYIGKTVLNQGYVEITDVEFEAKCIEIIRNHLNYYRRFD
ncbi:sulfatase-like hydrolase/transferase [Clostridium sp.]|uniref:sulfatase-like hydrolase/transferase n=1 Tax=Clostridium sp. TaxID=1506 RepID=UPI002FC5B9AD